MAKHRKHGRPAPGELDPLIHERLRLGILSALALYDSLSFTELRDLLQASDGNLSVQARKLEEAGTVACLKRFEDRKPKSTYKLTARGRGALEDYLETLAELLPSPAQVRRPALTRRGLLRPLPSHG